MTTKFLIPIALIIAAIALFFALTQPAMMTLSERQSVLTAAIEARDTAELVKDVQKELSEVRGRLDQNKLKDLSKLLPDGIDNVQLIIDINKMAIGHGAGMVLRNIKVGTDDGMTGGKVGPNTKKYGTVTLSFSATGSYDALKGFVNDLETSLRLIDISALSFTAGEQDSYEYNFEVKTYWLK